jgi:hypothetical protein
MVALLAQVLSKEQLEHMREGGWIPFILFSPPAGVISVSFNDPQVLYV